MAKEQHGHWSRFVVWWVCQSLTILSRDSLRPLSCLGWGADNVALGKFCNTGWRCRYGQDRRLVKRQHKVHLYHLESYTFSFTWTKDRNKRKSTLTSCNLFIFTLFFSSLRMLRYQLSPRRSSVRFREHKCDCSVSNRNRIGSKLHRKFCHRCWHTSKPLIVGLMNILAAGYSVKLRGCAINPQNYTAPRSA